MLGALGHEVVTRPNGRQALELVHDRGEVFDAILLDTIMPGIDGLEATRRLRSDARTRELVILCVAARLDGSDAVEGLEAGCDGYIKKPYQRIDLLAALSKALVARHVIAAGETLV